MKSLGIDIGSRTIKTVLLIDNKIAQWEVVDATSRPSRIARKLIEKHEQIPTVATGYGRHLLEKEGIPSVTEIKACACGSRFLSNDIRSIIDIGGQDLKTIALDTNGKVAKFEMNDRCAAGTGKFLEIMAQKLGYKIEEFGNAALKGKKKIIISSLCTVFAESEVIGLLNRDESPEDIALAVHYSAIKKITSMYKRISSLNFPVYLVGGGALNPALKVLLQQELETDVVVPDNPQTVIALGAGIIASEKSTH